MGTCKVDLKKRDLPFKNKSFSSVEDIYEILWKFDAIEVDRHTNNEALILYIDFMGMIEPYKYLKEYVFERTRIIDESDRNDYKYYQDILKIIADKNNITKKECEKLINKEIKKVVKDNKKKWSEYIERQYKNTVLFPRKIPKKEKNIINTKVAMKQNNCLESVEEPYELKSLKHALELNKKQIEKLNNIKHKTKKQREELNVRIKYKKELQEDIKIIKEHYGIEYKNNFNSRLEQVSFVNEDIFYYNYKNQLQVIIKDDDGYDVESAWQLEKTKMIAKEKLTDKQYIIFSLYYLNGFTQQDISDMLQTTRQYIQKEIRKIKLKIIKNL